MRVLLLLALAFSLMGFGCHKRPPAPPPPLPACPGDCNGDRVVTEDEVGTCRDIMLDDEATPPSTCPACDRDGNGSVDIGDLQAAVNSRLNGCP